MKKTIEQLYNEREGPEKCAKSELCKALSMALNFSDSNRGLVCKTLITFSTGKISRGIAYFGGDFKHGLRIRFCPFCGKPIPKLKEKR